MIDAESIEELPSKDTPAPDVLRWAAKQFEHPARHEEGFLDYEDISCNEVADDLRSYAEEIEKAYEPDDDPWEAYQTTDRQPWLDPNGNRHTYRTKKFDTPQKYLDEGCVWSPRDAEE